MERTRNRNRRRNRRRTMRGGFLDSIFGDKSPSIPGEKPKSLMGSLFGSNDSGSSFSFGSLFGSKPKEQTAMGVEMPNYTSTRMIPTSPSESPSNEIMPTTRGISDLTGSMNSTRMTGQNNPIYKTPYMGGSRKSRRRRSRRKRR
jgi:hypothetical protein